MLTHGCDSVSPTRAVVIGSRGFLGAAITAHLAERGWRTLGISSTEIDLLEDGAADAVAGLLREGDAVVMVSALTPDRGRGLATLERNVRMGAAVVEALRAVPCAHLVYVSSDAVYPDDAHPVSESTPAAPASLHGAMHLAREIAFREVCAATGAPLAVLRPSAVVGARDTHGSYGPNRFLRAALRGEPVALFGEGEERRDHVYVGDVARIVGLVLERRSHGTLNVVTGRSPSFREVAELAIAIAGSGVVASSPRANEIVHRYFDTRAAREAFPRFAWTPIEEALRLAAQELRA